jgi:hypothetical protein
MRFRELQLAAPRSSRELNIRLSVLSEVAYHVIDRLRPEASVAKLVVEISPVQFMGAALIRLPGNLAEFRVVDPTIVDEIDDLELRHMASHHLTHALAAMASDFAGRADHELAAALRREYEKAPPYEFELYRMARRDTSGRTLRLFHRFDADRSEVLLRSDDPAFKEQTIASAPFFIDLGGLFRATRTRISKDRIEFLAGTTPIASASLN